jgi:hypothetical protein
VDTTVVADPPRAGALTRAQILGESCVSCGASAALLIPAGLRRVHRRVVAVVKCSACWERQ